ncbi:MAG TPA: DUF3299 domain-containing protein [Dongiaceae bacterium]|nr:DUF3299 domain-containing protein [Dongiaceae bacterium]
MSRFILFAGIALFAAFICGFISQPENPRFSGSSEYKPPSSGPGLMQSDDQMWKNFAKCKIKTNQDLSYSITYIPAVKAMNGKNVIISGFMLPLEPKHIFSHFLLSKNAPTCAFCPPGGPNEVVEVFSSKPMVWKENLITISGKLILVNDGKKGVFFQMRDAEEM